ncbi:homeotic protein ultrabithorax [Frankliniella occidentalis]|uniref:Homeotic protein ultrabithorax n=1 Tax=Frankliniella occidentalis TaxID=133901 RepID=A0A9C6U1N7_FRAOC|nr:homeotic protein ultrabithorax [Frankliniella occidentalis]
MNSYFEQSGFYGSHHHQASAGAGAHHHDQAAAAYRFPLSLGMSPYASSQHHHHHLHQARPPQDSPYDASVAAACKLYSSGSDSSQQASVNYSTGASAKTDCVKSGLGDQQHQNGYAAVVAAAAKDVWQSANSANSAGANSLVRPSACTPDSRVGYGGSVGLVGGDPSTSPGSATARTSSATSLGGSWNTCSLNSTAAQPAVAVHQQSANHTFYPWMAIAGECPPCAAPARARTGCADIYMHTKHVYKFVEAVSNLVHLLKLGLEPSTYELHRVCHGFF